MPPMRQSNKKDPDTLVRMPVEQASCGRDSMASVRDFAVQTKMANRQRSAYGSPKPRCHKRRSL